MPAYRRQPGRVPWTTRLIPIAGARGCSRQLSLRLSRFVSSQLVSGLACAFGRLKLIRKFQIRFGQRHLLPELLVAASSEGIH